MFVCMSVTSLTQKRVDGFGQSFASRYHLGRGRTVALLGVPAIYFPVKITPLSDKIGPVELQPWWRFALSEHFLVW